MFLLNIHVLWCLDSIKVWVLLHMMWHRPTSIGRDAVIDDSHIGNRASNAAHRCVHKGDYSEPSIPRRSISPGRISAINASLCLLTLRLSVLLRLCRIRLWATPDRDCGVGWRDTSPSSPRRYDFSYKQKHWDRMIDLCKVNIRIM